MIDIEIVASEGQKNITVYDKNVAPPKALLRNVPFAVGESKQVQIEIDTHQGWIKVSKSFDGGKTWIDEADRFIPEKCSENNRYCHVVKILGKSEQEKPEAHPKESPAPE